MKEKELKVGDIIVDRSIFDARRSVISSYRRWYGKNGHIYLVVPPNPKSTSEKRRGYGILSLKSHYRANAHMNHKRVCFYYLTMEEFEEIKKKEKCFGGQNW